MTNATTLDTDYLPSDVTLVVSLRCHAENPWVLERLAPLLTHYEEEAARLVVDFGSREPYRSQVAALCSQLGVDCLYADDSENYCAARAKNLAAVAVKTPLIFFTDVDCLGESSLLTRLVQHANAQELGRYFDQLLSLPVYHFGLERTERVSAAGSARERDRELARGLASSVTSAYDTDSEYCAPYSNVFLCRTDFYLLTGGQHEAFRGHGWEDFEFAIRALCHAGTVPLPRKPLENCLAPASEEFYGPKGYVGFRRMLELASLPCELAGLRVAHLAHPRPRTGAHWYASHHSRRQLFSQVLESYLQTPDALVQIDDLPHQRQDWILSDPSSLAAALLPLRTAGVQLWAPPVTQEDLHAQALARLAQSTVGRVFVSAAVERQPLVAQLLKLALAAGVTVLRASPTSPTRYGLTAVTLGGSAALSVAEGQCVDECPSEAEVGFVELLLARNATDLNRTTRLNCPGFTFEAERACLRYSVAATSFAAARLGIGPELAHSRQVFLRPSASRLAEIAERERFDTVRRSLYRFWKRPLRSLAHSRARSLRILAWLLGVSRDVLEQRDDHRPRSR